MKICFLVGSVATMGGIQKVTSIVANELSNNNDVTVITTDSPDQIINSFNLINENIHFAKFPDYYGNRIFRYIIKIINNNTSFLNNKYLWPILKYNYVNKKLSKWIVDFCNTKDFDMVIAVNIDFAIILGSIADRIKAKTIGWQHNCTEALFFKKKIQFWHQDFLCKIFLPKLDRYVVLTEGDRKQVQKLFDIEPIVIPNPNPYKKTEKAKLSNKVMIASGRFVYAKGFDILIESFKIFSDKHPQWKLIILGNGPLRDMIQQRIEYLNLVDKVILIGTVKDVYHYYLQASMFILSSRWEGLPLVALEAQGCGLPIISFDIQAVDELIIYGINGFKVPLENGVQGLAQKMSQLADSPSLVKEMSQAAIKQIDNYKIENIIPKWTSLFENLR